MRLGGDIGENEVLDTGREKFSMGREEWASLVVFEPLEEDSASEHKGSVGGVMFVLGLSGSGFDSVVSGEDGVP